MAADCVINEGRSSPARFSRSETAAGAFVDAAFGDGVGVFAARGGTVLSFDEEGVPVAADRGVLTNEEQRKIKR